MTKLNYSVHVRCSCTGPDGRLLGQKCPALWRADGSWNPRHGSAGFATRIPTSADVKPLKRFGYASKAEAKADAEAVGKLLDLAGADSTTRNRIGDMVAAAKRGAPLPAAEDVRRRLGLGLDPSSAGVTIGEWLHTWLAGKRRTKRPSAVRSYEMHIRVWLEPHLGHIPLERLNAGHIEALFATIERFNTELNRQQSEGKVLIEIEGDTRAQPRQCGPSTQRRIFATLRAALNAAVKQRRIAWNPSAGIELENPRTPEAMRWTSAEAAKFIDATANDPMGLMFRIAVLRGARRGELCGFTWSSTDLDAGVLTAESTILQLGGKVTAGTPKTKAGERRIYLGAATAELLREHRKAQLAARLRAGETWEDHDLVFCQPDGRPWNPDYVSRRFKRLAAQTGIPVIKLHEARHSAISLMRDAGVDREIRMREAGHADQEVADRYTHVLDAAHRAAADQTETYVLRAGGAS